MRRSRRDTLDMTVGSPTKVLLVFAVPLILSNLFQQLYNMIDSLIVGNYLGADALAAVGSAGTITAVMVQMASGLALGASVVIAQYFGAGKKEKIRLCMTTICFFSVVVGVLVTVVTQVFATEILKIVKTPDGIMDESVKYLTIYFWGSVAIFLYNALQAVYIAMGDSKTPLYFLMVAFVLNVVGDLYFIVRWNLGVSGGALATTLSQLLCTVLSLVVLEGKMRRMGMERNQKIFDKTEFGRMMRIALPAALQQSVVSLGNVCVQMVTNSFGAVVMAGCAAANKGAVSETHL
ncbi:MAG: MATE family efflux transporter, partial [Lachnospiraceae bacterium]|nr:MATE family efflux transporter [Lachnospiraceae bacterium]